MKAIIILLTIISSALFAACASKQPIPEYVGYMKEKDYGIETNYISSGKEAQGTSYYLIYENTGRGGPSTIVQTIPSIYALDIHMSAHEKKLGSNDKENRWIAQRDLYYFSVDIYDIDTNQLLKTIDIKDILEQPNKKMQVIGVADYETRAIDGMPYLGFAIEDYPETLEAGMTNTRRMLWINLETESYLELELEDSSRIFPLTEKMNCLDKDDFVRDNFPDGKLSAEMSYYNSDLSYWKDVCSVRMLVELVPKENKALYAMFPKLKEQLAEIDTQAGEFWVKFHYTENPPLQKLMELSLPEDQEIVYKEFTLRPEDSVDGKEHVIHNLVEYEQYVKFEEGDATGVSPIFESRP